MLRRVFYWPETLPDPSPATMRCVHFWVGTITIFPGILVSYLLKSSLPFVVGLSMFAITYAAFSGWSAERPTETIP